MQRKLLKVKQIVVIFDFYDLLRRRAGIERELASRADQRVLR